MHEEKHWNHRSRYATCIGDYITSSSVCVCFDDGDKNYTNTCGTILFLPGANELVFVVPDYWQKYLPSRPVLSRAE